MTEPTMSPERAVAEVWAYLSCGKPSQYLEDADVVIYLLDQAGYVVIERVDE